MRNTIITAPRPPPPPSAYEAYAEITRIYAKGPLFKSFIESLNYHHPTIKLTATWSVKKVTFEETPFYLAYGQISVHVPPNE